MVVLAAVICGGCSYDGEPDQPEMVAGPTLAQAEPAIKHSRFNVATDPARSIHCTKGQGTTVCSVDFAEGCNVLTVSRRAGDVVVAEARDGACMHVLDVSTSTSFTP